MTGSSPVMTMIRGIRSHSYRSGGLGLDLLQQPGGLAAVQPGDVVLILEQHAQGIVDRVRGQLEHVELHQRLGPVDRLGDAGKLEEIHPTQLLDKADDLARQAVAGAGGLALQDLEFARGGRIIDPIVKTAPLQRIVDLAGPVRGNDPDRRRLGADRTDFWDRSWKSESSSNRYASNGSSVRSSSSISNTGEPSISGASACNNGRLIRNRSEKIVLSISPRSSSAASARRISIIWRA